MEKVGPLSPEKKSPNLRDFVEAAKREDWEFVDTNLPSTQDKGNFAEWAVSEGIYSKDENVRDLGASILEISTYDLGEERKEKAKKRLTEMLAEKTYAGFRAACALINRGFFEDLSLQSKIQVKEQLLRISDDEGKELQIREVAKNYIEFIR